MTSWIDGSFVYSSQEAWANTMRSFRNGSLAWMDEASRMPPYNINRLPIFANNMPHVLRTMDPRKLFGKPIATIGLRSIGLRLVALFYSLRLTFAAS